MIDQDCLIDIGAVGSVVVQPVAELGVDHSAVVGSVAVGSMAVILRAVI